MRLDKVTSLIQEGHTTTGEISQQLGLDKTHVSRELKGWAEDGDLAREKRGRAYHYYVPADENAEGAGRGGVDADAGAVALPEDYDWDDWVPSDIPQYIPTDGEFEEIRAEIEGRHLTGRPAHIRLTGPTGAGKTHLPRYYGQQEGLPVFSISVKWATDTTDLIGRYVYVNDETRWVNGPLTKAIMASRDRPVILLLDEVNRARPEAKAALFEALDDRASVTIDALGGRTVEGDALNLITFSTMNVGTGHMVEDLDLAEQRRLGGTWSVNYLGLEHPEREAGLLADRLPVHDGFASDLVECANDVRNLAQEPSEAVDRGIPTGLLIEWAASAYQYAENGLANPVMRAAKSQVLRAFYADGDRDAPGRDAVAATLQSHFDNMPAEAVGDTDEWEAWTGKTLSEELGVDGDDMSL